MKIEWKCSRDDSLNAMRKSNEERPRTFIMQNTCFLYVGTILVCVSNDLALYSDSIIELKYTGWKYGTGDIILTADEVVRETGDIVVRELCRWEE